MQHPQTAGAILDLRQRLLAACVQDQLARSGYGPRHLQKERGLAYARLTAYEQGASRVKSYGRIAKLSLQVNGEYEELRRVYTEIGKLCYDRHKDAPEELFAPLFSQVEEIGSRIKSMEDEIEAVKAEVSGAGDDGDITVEVVAEPVDEAAERAAEYRAAAEDFQAVVDAETDGENKD